MSEPRWLLDTNILIEHLNGTLPSEGAELQRQAFREGGAVSIISRIELLGWRKHTPASRKASEELLVSLTVVSLSETIAEQTIQLRNALPIKLPDAVIAATALVLRVPLLTRNYRDFQKVPNLALPWQPTPE